ncbi:exonuclease domain-containing protein [Bosea massiliensis]|uniref:Exonuclease domain-containing protein n=1 Tax=Bosea massiliensis TaxID=151419 RepID=A0ABW0P9J4_9HYPH
MILRCVDFETTGEPSEENPQAVCEVGFCDVVFENGVASIGMPWSMLVDPGRPMPADARAVHHISDDDVAMCPPATTAFMRLTGNAGGVPKADYYCAHNADYELAFFKGGETPWICTFKVAVRLWPDEQKHSLQYLRYALALDIDQDVGLPAHRAGPDAYVGAALMAAILNRGANQVDLATMVRWSKGPALFQRLSFGKHRGKRFDEVPLDYLYWIQDKSDMSADIKANAKHWIKQRAINNGSST